MNDLTTAVLMATGGMAGLFLGDIKKGRDLFGSCFLLPFFAFAFYFSLRISTSDAALILLVSLFFFLAVLLPDWRAFSVTWVFFLMIVIVGIVLMTYSEPLNFKALLSIRKLESFLSFRPQGWLASLSLIRENPWIGIGSGLYKQFYEALLPLLPGKSVVLAHSHCLYLVHFVAHGTVAGIAFISLIVLNLRLVFACLKREETVSFALMVAGIWFFALTYGLVELTPASREMVPLVWGPSGLLAGVYAQKGTSPFRNENTLMR
ncbi:MAG: O-antigen ligase family protein [Aminobacteriaceae bacterium]